MPTGIARTQAQLRNGPGPVVILQVGSALTAASTITVVDEIHAISGATHVQTINHATSGYVGDLTLVASGSDVTFVSGGNVAITSNLVIANGTAARLAFDGTSWHPVGGGATLPTVSGADNAKALMVRGGAWGASFLSTTGSTLSQAASITVTNEIHAVSAGSGAPPITTITHATSGYTGDVTLVATGSRNVVLVSGSGNLLLAASTLTLAPGQAVRLTFDGTSWYSLTEGFTIALGQAISGAPSGAVLFVNSSGVLDGRSGFTFDPTSGQINVPGEIWFPMLSPGAGLRQFGPGLGGGDAIAQLYIEACRGGDGTSSIAGGQGGLTVAAGGLGGAGTSTTAPGRGGDLNLNGGHSGGSGDGGAAPYAGFGNANGGDIKMSGGAPSGPSGLYGKLLWAGDSAYFGTSSVPSPLTVWQTILTNTVTSIVSNYALNLVTPLPPAASGVAGSPVIMAPAAGGSGDVGARPGVGGTAKIVAGDGGALNGSALGANGGDVDIRVGAGSGSANNGPIALGANGPPPPLITIGQASTEVLIPGSIVGAFGDVHPGLVVTGWSGNYFGLSTDHTKNSVVFNSPAGDIAVVLPDPTTLGLATGAIAHYYIQGDGTFAGNTIYVYASGSGAAGKINGIQATFSTPLHIRENYGGYHLVTEGTTWYVVSRWPHRGELAFSFADAFNSGAFSPTGTTGNFTVGNRLSFRTAGMVVMGCRFYWLDAASAGSRTVTCDLWSPSGTSLASGTGTVNGAGEYTVAMSSYFVLPTDLQKVLTLTVNDATGYTSVSTSTWNTGVPALTGMYGQAVGDGIFVLSGATGSGHAAPSTIDSANYYPIDLVLGL